MFNPYQEVSVCLQEVDMHKEGQQYLIHKTEDTCDCFKKQEQKLEILKKAKLEWVASVVVSVNVLNFL